MNTSKKKHAKMDLLIVVKHNLSKCNIKLIKFLKSNKDLIAKKYNLRLLPIPEDLCKKFSSDVKGLPILLTWDEKIAVGNSQIIKNIKKGIGYNTPTSKYTPPSDDINDYWSRQMFSKDQEGDGEPSDLMESVRQRALSRTMTHKDQMNKNKKQIDPVIPDSREDREKLETIQIDRISDFTDDPIAKKFWENQETTPGFNN